MSQTNRRHALKQATILQALRRQIVSGEFPPGARLPSRQDLARRFSSSLSTVQPALAELQDDGFVQPRGKLGTFVRQDAPHLCRYALVCPKSPQGGGLNPQWSQFWTALGNESRQMHEPGRYEFQIYYGLEEREGSPDFHRLCTEVEKDRLAGLIFYTGPNYLLSTTIITRPGIPRVAIMDLADAAGVAAISPDAASFMDRALEFVHARGRRRVAVLTCVGQAQSYREHVAARCDALGMHIEPHWVQHVNSRATDWAGGLVQLLMQGPADQRPDALIIADDNIVDSATAGLVQAGLRTPDDLDAVAFTNFPWSPPTHVAVTRLGFDTRRLLQLCIDNLNQQRRGVSPATVTMLPAIFESER